ncbi:NAD-specific glutamate dehydrogenase [compost metagenome]
MAHWICGGDILFAFLEVINTAQRSAEPLDKVAMIFFGVGERLGLDRFNQAIDNYQPLNHWQVLARDTYLSDLTAQQSALTSAIMNGGSEEIAPVHMIESWKSNREPELCRWDKFSSDLFSTEGTDLSAFAVVIRELVELTKSSGRTAAVSS